MPRKFCNFIQEGVSSWVQCAILSSCLCPAGAEGLLATCAAEFTSLMSRYFLLLDSYSSLCSMHMAVTRRKHEAAFGKTLTTRVRRFSS